MAIMNDKQHVSTITINKFIKKHNFNCGVELGVRCGDFTEFLCKDNANLKMIAVDLWGAHECIPETHDHILNFNICMKKFEPFKDRILVIRKLTVEAAKVILDNTVDFVFIDATHTRNALVEDIKAWLPKIKENGIICGHDYHPHWDDGKLKQCIDELFPKKITDEWTCWLSYKRDIDINKLNN